MTPRKSMKYEPITVGKNWEQRGMSDRQKKAEHAGAIMKALEGKMSHQSKVK